ncbi:FUSC family protein, partial [Paraburkholderia sp. SIMBA_030]|uniref:FUSC family protein n=1 Tax=Paraburkholderia sp. SIMBA_030 TaxID=3085773 RepID=UPI003978830A
MSLAAGVRASAVLLLLGSYWLLSDWPSGGMMTLIATVTVGLSAASPNPKRMSFQMACGTAIGAFVG